MNKTLKYILLFCMFSCAGMLVAQRQVNSSYFIYNDPLRHTYNAAFQPNANLYISAPFFGQTQFGVNLPVSLSDMIKKVDGQERWFLDPARDGRQDLLAALGKNPSTGFDFGMNLLSVGFRVKKSYFTFTLYEKITADVYLPRGVFDLLFDGLAPNGENNNEFTLNAGFDASAYTEAAFGYSRIITDELTAGIKLKALLGQGNVSMRNDNLKLYTGIDEWKLQGGEEWNASLPFDRILDENMDWDFVAANKFKDIIANGMGAAIDLGADYRFKHFPLIISLGINDLGFIRWNGTSNLNYDVNYAFDGVYIDSLGGNNIGSILDTLVGGIEKGFNYRLGEKTPYTRRLAAKINAGAEYGFLQNKFTVGLLYHRAADRNSFTGALNLRPAEWFNFSLNYSLLDNFKATNLGLAYGFRIAWFHFNFATDFISLNNARISSLTRTINNEIGGSVKIKDVAWVPYRTSAFNAKFGASLVFGSRRDRDRDGVKDWLDLCPKTPRRVQVDENGCPIEEEPQAPEEVEDDNPQLLIFD